jgi:hypothetical protein
MEFWKLDAGYRMLDIINSFLAFCAFVTWRKEINNKKVKIRNKKVAIHIYKDLTPDPSPA